MKSIKDEASRGLAKITNMVAVANKEIVSMVLIGETGSGKSSLINLFSFWARESLGGQPQFGDAKRLSILRHDNEAGSSQSGSQTLKPHVYQFDVQMNGRDYHCSILDSPGMGDVAGLENDDEHIGAILKFVEETSSINGIILMLNGSNCRMSPRTHYILQRLYSMCAKTFEEHIYLIFSNTQLRPNFDWKNEIKVPVDPNRVVPFDNLLYSPAGLEYEHLSAFEKMKIESNYVENKKTLSVLFETLRKGGALLPDVYKQLRENRDTLRVKVSGILKSMCESSSIKLDLEQKMHDLRSPTLIRDLLLQKAQLTTNRLEIEQISTPYHNTQCLTCSVTCHENCQLSFTPQPGHDIFEGCACMNDGKCSGCTHDYKTHAHINFIYKRKIVSEPLITDAELEELKSLETTVAMQKFILDKHQMKLTVGNHQAQQLTQDLRNALRELNALCPYYDYRMELKCALELLKEAKRVNTGRYDREEVERLEEHFRRLLVDFNQAEAYQP